MGAITVTIVEPNLVIFQPGFDGHRFTGNRFQAVVLGVFGEFLGKLGTGGVDNARIIFDFIRIDHLAARRTEFDKQGL